MQTHVELSLVMCVHGLIVKLFLTSRPSDGFFDEDENEKRLSDMTPEIRTLISGVIFMTKYTKEIKLAIY
ncbi:hypothetical protein, partial [Lactobacillus delbrueckii]